MRLIATSALTAVEVRSPAGEEVGRVVDFMLDTQRGTVVYAVLSVGGVLGVGAKMLAVPPAAMTYDSGQRLLALAVDATALDEAPGIDRANPPEHAEAELIARAPPAPRRESSIPPRSEGKRHG